MSNELLVNLRDERDAWKEKYKELKIQIERDCVECKEDKSWNKVDTKRNLCETCISSWPTCRELANDNITFGDGVGLDNVIDCNCYSPYTKLKVVRIERVRELAENIRMSAFDNKPPEFIINIDEAERLITDFIEKREAGKYGCQKDCIAYNTEIGCNTCVRKVNDNYISIKGGNYE